MPPPDPARFRAAMAMLPTGVTVVSAAGPEGPAGATANAVCSLSIEPMLMLACLDRGSRTLLAVQAANHFGISVLHAGQEEIARSFATKAPVADKWQGVAWSDRDGIPAINEQDTRGRAQFHSDSGCVARYRGTAGFEVSRGGTSIWCATVERTAAELYR